MSHQAITPNGYVVTDESGAEASVTPDMAAGNGWTLIDEGTTDPAEIAQLNAARGARSALAARANRRGKAYPLLCANFGATILPDTIAALTYWRDTGSVIAAAQIMPAGNGIEVTTGLSGATVEAQLNALNAMDWGVDGVIKAL